MNLECINVHGVSFWSFHANIYPKLYVIRERAYNKIDTLSIGPSYDVQIDLSKWKRLRDSKITVVSSNWIVRFIFYTPSDALFNSRKYQGRKYQGKKGNVSR